MIGEEENENKWPIPIDKEREIWTNKLIPNFIRIPDKCPICKIGIIYLRKNNSLNNPFLGKCNKYNCNREIYLRKGTIFAENNKTPCSVLFKVLELWLLEEHNVQEIIKHLISYYNKEKIDNRFIYSFVDKLRQIIATHMKNVYKIEQLASPNSNNHISIDESLFSHQNGEQIWVVGLLNNETNALRLEMVKDRSSEVLEYIITKHIGTGNICITDGWQGYSFLNRINSGYVHHSYNHGRGQWGMGLDSTSRIESIWSEIKLKIKRMYISIKSTNLIYFLKEAEYRRLISKLSNENKLKDFSLAYSTVGDLLLSEKELVDFKYETLYDN